jgi:hypothetical protein
MIGGPSVPPPGIGLLDEIARFRRTDTRLVELSQEVVEAKEPQ